MAKKVEKDFWGTLHENLLKQDEKSKAFFKQYVTTLQDKCRVALEGEYLWKQEAIKNINNCEKLLQSNDELVDIGSTIVAIAALDKVQRGDINKKLKQALLTATRLNKTIIKNKTKVKA